MPKGEHLKGKIPAHAWKPGQSGNPGGMPRGTKSPTQMMRDLLKEGTPEGVTKARQLAEVLYKKALAGDVRAIELFLERVDGKTKEQLEISRTGESVRDDDLKDVLLGKKKLEDVIKPDA